MKIFYMNQGGKGNHGAVGYLHFNILLIAESDNEFDGFDRHYISANKPHMSIHVRKPVAPSDGVKTRAAAAASSSSSSSSGHDTRSIVAIKDLDATASAVRPLVSFQLKEPNIRVVFVHLKSGSQALAEKELTTAKESIEKIQVHNQPTLWVGDFNRALVGQSGFTPLFKGGGQAAWYLDRVYVSHWKKGSEPTAKGLAVNTADHGHEGLVIEFQ